MGSRFRVIKGKGNLGYADQNPARRSALSTMIIPPGSGLC